jgi:predicted enzyme related to lactoylglutathione lyase
MPADLAFQDLAHWQVRVRVEDLDAVAERVAGCGGRVLSQGIISLRLPC